MCRDTKSASVQHLLDGADPAGAGDPVVGLEIDRVVEDHRHAEAEVPAAGHRHPDPAHAQDAQRLAGDVGAHHVGGAPSGPAPGADLAFPLAGPAGDHQQQGHRGIGGGVGEHPRGVRHDDSGLGRGLGVDVVVADAEVAQEPGPQLALEQLGRQPVGDSGQHDVGLLQRGAQPVAAQRDVVGVEPDIRKAPRQFLLDRGRPAPGDDDDGLLHGDPPPSSDSRRWLSFKVINKEVSCS